MRYRTNILTVTVMALAVAQVGEARTAAQVNTAVKRFTQRFGGVWRLEYASATDVKRLSTPIAWQTDLRIADELFQAAAAIDLASLATFRKAGTRECDETRATYYRQQRQGVDIEDAYIAVVLEFPHRGMAGTATVVTHAVADDEKIQSAGTTIAAGDAVRIASADFTARLKANGVTAKVAAEATPAKGLMYAHRRLLPTFRVRLEALHNDDVMAVRD